MICFITLENIEHYWFKSILDIMGQTILLKDLPHVSPPTFEAGPCTKACVAGSLEAVSMEVHGSPWEPNDHMVCTAELAVKARRPNHTLDFLG